MKVKLYTDVEQSKKLAEILPLESADMHYSKDFDGSWFVDLAKYTSVKIPKYVGNIEEHLLPCWSLAALLEQFEDTAGLARDYGSWFCYDNRKSYHTKHYNNPVDACVDMIIKLHEQNLL